MTRPILLAQCKSYQTFEEVTKTVDHLIKMYPSSDFHLHLSLPYSFIEPIRQKVEGQEISVGAEVLLDADEGSFTASNAGNMLEKTGAQFVLIGTSQDRTSHSATSHHLKNKVRAVLNTKVPPFVCIGETLHDHQDQKSKEVLTNQLKDALEGFSAEELAPIHIVYNAEWISRTPWEAKSPELHQAYQTFHDVVNEVLGEGTVSKEQRIVAIPAYSRDLPTVIRHLQEDPHSASGYSLGILTLSVEFLQPLFEKVS